jgi:predicted DNA-binding transcriptional regulator YafY
VGAATIRVVSPSQVRPAATLPPVALTPEQAAAVVAALSAHVDGPYARHGLGALLKVLDVLEPDPERRAALVASSLETFAGGKQAAAPRTTVERAVAEHRVLAIRYRDGNGRPSRREVEPQFLARSSDHWFLVAWCRDRDAPRWFRLDRVAGAESTGETAPRRNPVLFGAPSDTHPAGRALDRGSPPAPDHPAATDAPRRGLRLIPGGRR